MPFGAIAVDLGGVEIGATAGGEAVALRSAAQAVRCAVAIQEAQEAPSALAVGVHAGEVLAGEGPEAPPVVLATRLATLAGAGMVLASLLVRELVSDDPNLRFGAGREASLPGLAGRMTVHLLQDPRAGAGPGGRPARVERCTSAPRRHPMTSRRVCAARSNRAPSPQRRDQMVRHPWRSDAR